MAQDSLGGSPPVIYAAKNLENSNSELSTRRGSLRGYLPCWYFLAVKFENYCNKRLLILDKNSSFRNKNC